MWQREKRNTLQFRATGPFRRYSNFARKVAEDGGLIEPRSCSEHVSNWKHNLIFLQWALRDVNLQTCASRLSRHPWSTVAPRQWCILSEISKNFIVWTVSELSEVSLSSVFRCNEEALSLYSEDRVDGGGRFSMWSLFEPLMIQEASLLHTLKGCSCSGENVAWNILYKACATAH